MDDFFLPDFCAGRSVASVMAAAQLVVFLLILARPGGPEPWLDLLRMTLFLQWIALVSAAVLCLARDRLAAVPVTRAALLAFALLVMTALAMAEVAWRAAHWLGLGAELVPAGHTAYLMRTIGLSAIVSAVVLRYLYVQHQWRLRVKAEAGSRFAALQARIRPHFLFNSMNTIAALTRSDAEAAETAVEDLSDLFRASLADASQRVTLDDEFALCRRYVRIERLRLGDRLQVDWDIDALPGGARIPGLIVQPLVENAIYHGVEPAVRAVTVKVTGRLDAGMMEIETRNPMPPDRTGPHHGLRIALDNVAERLALAFPGRGTLDARAEGDEFVVTIRCPHEEDDADPDR